MFQSYAPETSATLCVNYTQIKYFLKNDKGLKQLGNGKGKEIKMNRTKKQHSTKLNV